MKLNLPATWTSEKMTTLFLLTFLKISKVESGQAFKNCLTSSNRPIYNPLTNFPFSSDSDINSGKVIDICCESSNSWCRLNKDIPLADNDTWTWGLCPKDHRGFFCNKLGNSEYYCNGRSVPCSGIIGDTTITNDDVKGNCSISNNITAISSYLNTTLPNGMNEGYAHLDCPSDSPCQNLVCNWDNGGWICATNYKIEKLNVNNNCYLQWAAPWPGKADKDPFNPPTPKSDDGLSTSDKIAIGVAVPGGIASLVAVLETYRRCRKKNKGKEETVSHKISKQSYKKLEESSRQKDNHKVIDNEQEYNAQIELLSYK